MEGAFPHGKQSRRYQSGRGDSTPRVERLSMVAGADLPLVLDLLNQKGNRSYEVEAAREGLTKEMVE